MPVLDIQPNFLDQAKDCAKLETVYSRYVPRTLIQALLCRDLVNKYIPDRVLHKDQCTLQDCIRLFNSVLKIFSVYTDIVLLEYA